MEEWKQRVQAEFADMLEKERKLTDFINNNTYFFTLHVVDKSLLLEQLRHMTAYRSVLERRIARF